MRVLITGATGFVGPYAVRALRQHFGDTCQVVATGRGDGNGGSGGLDILDPDNVTAAIRAHQPTHILNLAGIAAPARAASNPVQAWDVHLRGTVILADAILREAPTCWLLHAGSGLVYGGTARQGEALTERSLLDPMDVYAASKAAGDLALGAYANKGLKVLRLRPFNHTGVGQSVDFVVPAFAVQVAQIEAGSAEPCVQVGNLEAERDFLDVRDVARAYALAVACADDLTPGTIINIASGTPTKIADILNYLISRSTAAIEVSVDPSRVRPVDIKTMVGDASRAQELLGWKPEFSLAETLDTILEHYRRESVGSG